MGLMNADRTFTPTNILRLGMLAAWVLGISWLLGNNRYQSFIRAELWPLLAAGLVMLLLFLIGVYARLMHSSSHGHAPTNRWSQAGLMLLPLLYMVVAAAPGGLGSYAFQQRYIGTAQPSGASAGRTELKKNDAGEYEVTILDLVSETERLEGETVIVDGMVYRDETLAESQFIAFRFVIVCCAADAVPVGTHIEFDGAGAFDADTWVRVRGQLETRDSGDGPTPWIAATSIEPIDAPARIYLSPY